MKNRNDYLPLIKKQCDCICSGGSNSATLFDEVCRKLEKDFLPPIEREDIASISLNLFEISRNCRKEKLGDGIKKQIELTAMVIEELLNKKKTCGENVRRLIALNSDFRAGTLNEEKINVQIKFLLGRINEAYFRNL